MITHRPVRFGLHFIDFIYAIGIFQLKFNKKKQQRQKKKNTHTPEEPTRNLKNCPHECHNSNVLTSVSNIVLSLVLFNIHFWRAEIFRRSWVGLIQSAAMHYMWLCTFRDICSSNRTLGRTKVCKKFEFLRIRNN